MLVDHCSYVLLLLFESGYIRLVCLCSQQFSIFRIVKLFKCLQVPQNKYGWENHSTKMCEWSPPIDPLLVPPSFITELEPHPQQPNVIKLIVDDVRRRRVVTVNFYRIESQKYFAAYQNLVRQMSYSLSSPILIIWDLRVFICIQYHSTNQNIDFRNSN